MKNGFLWSLAFGLLLGCSNPNSASAPVASSSTLAAAVVDTSPAVHGMVLFGTDQLYASHVPMYMSPHDWQALFKVSISHATVDALATYAKANLASKQVYFTLAPKPFVLPKLLDGRITSFQADLYKGSFENGGKRILTNITVQVEQVVYKTQLSKHPHSLSALTYLSIEAGSASYLAHQISAPDNFDHIVQIEWLNKTPADAETSETPADESASADPVFNNGISLDPIATPALAAAPVAHAFELKDTEANRLEVGEYFTVATDGSIAKATSVADASFKVISSFYCTQGPDFYNPCN